MKPVEHGLVPAGVHAAEAIAWRAGVVERQPDWLAEEVPVALVVNGISHAVMLATPSDLEDFALGFAFTEGLVEQTGQLYGVDVEPAAGGIELRLAVASSCERALKERRRTLAGRTGCGLCGTDSLAQVRQPLSRLEPLPLRPAALTRAQHELRRWQALQQLTGATHAAAWCTTDGAVRLVREDVGRHNALDKVIGALLRERADPHDGFVCITSRASFEMVQKTARAGIAALAAVSAPTALAVETAASCGLLLTGFVRGETLVAYTFAERLGLITDFDRAWTPTT